MLVSDVLLLPFELWTAIALRLGDWWPNIVGLHWLLLLAPVVAIPVFIKIGLYRAVIRYMEDEVIASVLQGVTLAVLMLVAVAELLGIQDAPRSSFAIYWGIGLIYIMGSRMMARAYFRGLKLKDNSGGRRPVAIYGAGETGVKSAAALHAGQHFRVVAFFDDNVDCHGSEVGGIRIFAPAQMAAVLAQEVVELVLLAIPSATRERRSEIIREINRFKVSAKTIPSMFGLVNDSAKVDEIREVEIEDLLGRDPVQPMIHLLELCIRDKSVMVTGAGGSIIEVAQSGVVVPPSDPLILAEAMIKMRDMLEQNPALGEGGFSLRPGAPRSCQVGRALATAYPAGAREPDGRLTETAVFEC